LLGIECPKPKFQVSFAQKTNDKMPAIRRQSEVCNETFFASGQRKTHYLRRRRELPEMHQGQGRQRKQEHSTHAHPSQHTARWWSRLGMRLLLAQNPEIADIPQSALRFLLQARSQ